MQESSPIFVLWQRGTHTCPKDLGYVDLQLGTSKNSKLINKLEFVGELCRSTGLQSRLEAPLFRD